jgi:uncharacterized protein (DUF1778 family)
MSSGTDKRQRTVVLPLRLRPDEAALIRQKAEASSVSVSAFLRAAALGKPLRAKDDVVLAKEVRRLGGLLKHQFNESQHKSYSHETAKLLEEIGAAIKRIYPDDC